MTAMSTSYLAIDVGGGSGRGIVGTLEGRRLTLREVHRFANYHVPVAGRDYWDLFHLFHEMIECVRRAQREHGDLSSFCVDLWGNDIAFLDKNGQPIGYPWCTRNSDGSAMEAFFRDVMPPEAYFMQCGSQVRRGNAVFQLYERMLERDPALAHAERILTLPDLFGYFFTGRAYSEFTIATTTQLIDPFTGGWNGRLIRALGLPEHLFGEIVLPGTRRYDLLPGVLPEAAGRLKYAPAASHDTASAVTTLTVAPDEAFCSSGTWSIIGAECDGPTINREVLAYNFSNEGCADGRWRLQKDIMGMWCMQNLHRGLCETAGPLSWDEIVRQAEAAEPFRSLVNLEEPVFVSDADPAETIRAYCGKTGQPVPAALGEIARCVYESMALQYRQTLAQLRELSGREFTKLRIVGGGGKNGFLNQMIADAARMRVEAGPYESASVGGILLQAAAEGKIQTADFPEIVRSSFEVRTFTPRKERAPLWDAAADRYREYCGNMVL